MAKISLSEVLQLDISNSSIKKIDAFLASEVEYSDPYMKALAYKYYIEHKLGNSLEAVNVLVKYIKNLNILTPYSIIAISDSLIQILLDLNNFDEAYKYIQLKKNFLPVSKLNLYLKDMITYLLKKDSINKQKIY